MLQLPIKKVCTYYWLIFSWYASAALSGPFKPLVYRNVESALQESTMRLKKRGVTFYKNWQWGLKTWCHLLQELTMRLRTWGKLLRKTCTKFFYLASIFLLFLLFYQFFLSIFPIFSLIFTDFSIFYRFLRLIFNFSSTTVQNFFEWFFLVLKEKGSGKSL